MELCVAKPNLLRCIGCFVFPFVMLGWYVYKVASKGVDSVPAFLSSVGSSGWNAVSAVLLIGGLLAWILVTWPKARLALRYRGCAIGLDDGMLKVYGDRVNRGDIASVACVRRPFDYLLCIQRNDGSTVARSITLLSPKPELIAQRLKEAGL
jgi:hypothetical protein